MYRIITSINTVQSNNVFAKIEFSKILDLWIHCLDCLIHLLSGFFFWTILRFRAESVCFYSIFSAVTLSVYINWCLWPTAYILDVFKNLIQFRHTNNASRFAFICKFTEFVNILENDFKTSAFGFVNIADILDSFAQIQALGCHLVALIRCLLWPFGSCSHLNWSKEC